MEGWRKYVLGFIGHWAYSFMEGSRRFLLNSRIIMSVNSYFNVVRDYVVLGLVLMTVRGLFRRLRRCILPAQVLIFICQQ